MAAVAPRRRRRRARADRGQRARAGQPAGRAAPAPRVRVHGLPARAVRRLGSRGRASSGRGLAERCLPRRRRRWSSRTPLRRRGGGGRCGEGCPSTPAWTCGASSRTPTSASTSLPAPIIARECVEALRFGTPIIVPEHSGPAAVHARAGGGSTFGDPGELIVAAEKMRSEANRSAASDAGRRYADSPLRRRRRAGDPDADVARSGLTRPSARHAPDLGRPHRHAALGAVRPQRPVEERGGARRTDRARHHHHVPRIPPPQDGPGDRGCDLRRARRRRTMTSRCRARRAPD